MNTIIVQFWSNIVQKKYKILHNFCTIFAHTFLFLSCGKVFKANDNETGQNVAIKIIPIETDNYKEIEREINKLKMCNSKYLVNYLGVYRTEDKIWVYNILCLL